MALYWRYYYSSESIFITTKNTELPQPAFERFCLVLAQIPPGKVCSYGHLATLAGLPHARQACQYLRRLPAQSRLPWYRIVNAQGKLAHFSNAGKQRQLLEREGIVFSPAGRILREYFFENN